MKKCILPHSINATLLSAVAAVMLLGPAPAHASTSEWRGGNWADPTGGNFSTGVIYPTGITSSTTTTQAATVADTIAADDSSIGINIVRIGINPPTISDNWPVVQAYVNELVKDGMTVDLGCWCEKSIGDGKIDSGWQTMWETVDSVYSGSFSVYYEPLNEPYGYTTEAELATDVYVPFLGFIHKSQNNIILDGTGYADDVTAVGADSRFTGCLLGIHIYPWFWGKYTTESGWESALATHVGSYANRTIMTEMGAAATTGLNYGVSSSDVNVCFIRGIANEVRDLNMGMVYWPSHRANDSYRLFDSPGGGLTNPTLLQLLEFGWGSNEGSELLLDPCDFDGIGSSEFTIFRPSTGQWYSYNGPSGTSGINGDIAVPADYLGEGHDQIAVWRPSNGTWYVSGAPPSQFGTLGDIPVPGDYRGAGFIQKAVFRPSTGQWFVAGGATVQFGQSGDIPVPGGYTEDTTQIAVFRPSTGQWLIYGGPTIQFGEAGDTPVPGNWYGDFANNQPAVWRGTLQNPVWFIYGVKPGIAWGAPGDVPLELPYAIRQYMGYSD